MDTTDPNISFDLNGNCNHCTQYFKTAKCLLNKNQHEILEKIKEYGEFRRYDCLLGVGGGCDCSYLAYLAHNIGLRLLLVHLDNGWNTCEAEHNIKAIVEKTGFPFLRYKINSEEFNDVVLSFMKASVIDIEVATDHAATALLFKVAKEKRIKFLLTGSNWVSEAIMPQAWGYRKNDLQNLKAIHNRFGKVKLKTYPTISILNLVYYQTIKGMHMVPLLNYICYNREEAKKTLVEFCGWKDYGSKHYENIWTRFYQRYILPKKFNVDKRRAHLSTLICSGQITREQTLEELEKPLYAKGELEQEKSYVLDKLGLTGQEFEDLMNLPVRRHQDYGSDEWLYNLLRNSRVLVGFLVRRFMTVKRLLKK